MTCKRDKKLMEAKKYKLSYLKKTTNKYPYEKDDDLQNKKHAKQGYQ